MSSFLHIHILINEKLEENLLGTLLLLLIKYHFTKLKYSNFFSIFVLIKNGLYKNIAYITIFLIFKYGNNYKMTNESQLNLHLVDFLNIEFVEIVLRELHLTGFQKSIPIPI